MALILGTLGLIVARAQQQSREHLISTLKLRGATEATLIGTYVSQQAQREKGAAERFLSSPDVSQHSFELITAAFGSNASVLLDESGRVIGVVPYKRSLIGKRIVDSYEHLRLAESGLTAVSNVVPSVARGERVSAVAVPFQTVLMGKRVFSAAYGIGDGELSALVSHASTTPGHRVLLVDGHDNVLAASPRTHGETLTQADAQLAQASAHNSFGSVPHVATPSTFVASQVPGTPWRVLIEVPNSALFLSISGMAAVVPWVIFGLVTLLGAMLLALYARSLADRGRLSRLSDELESVARTDHLTGLLNRRGFAESAARFSAHARRHHSPLSLLMIDLDRFKEVNDRHGHEAGDQVLTALADCLRDVLRGEDIPARLGGDEFVVALADTDEAAARVAARRLMSAAGEVDLSALDLEEGIPMSIGVSSGIHTTVEELMRHADEELYRVKSERRNARILSGSPAPER